MINIIPVFTVKYNTGIISSTFRSLGGSVNSALDVPKRWEKGWNSKQ